MKHALEADHVAGVAALATRVSSVGDRVRLAGMWGVGHAGAITVVGVAVLALGLGLPPALARGFEGMVGIMLILLGADVLRRFRSRHVHFHAHRHDDGTLHFHAHAHEPSRVHLPADHAHEHPRTGRALLVGTAHGLAGSAALLLVSLGAAHSTADAVAYLALFGVGSIVGMCALSLAISLPLRHLSRGLGSPAHVLEGVVGVLTIALGSWIALSVVFVGK
jgi:cytochrome c biogenesis protein CcdA